MSRSSLGATDTLYSSLPQYNVAPAARLNDPYAWMTSTDFAPPSHHRASNAVEAASAFFNYRVDGMKISARPYLAKYECADSLSSIEADNFREIMRNGQYALVTDATIDGNSANSALPLNPYLQQDTSRFGKIIPFTAQGTSVPRWKSVYYGVKQVQGTSTMVKGDIDYTGQTDNTVASGFDSIARPAFGPRVRIGITNYTGSYVHGFWPAATEAGAQTIQFHVPMKITWYVTYFGKRPITNY